MKQVKAIGFDLFNTLITAEPHTLNEAVDRLVRSLEQDGLSLDPKRFKHAHGEEAVGFIQKTRKKGRETHNRFWISGALKTLGYRIPPDDPRIAGAVDAYFSAFLENCHLIPGTVEMLGALKDHYRLGLLSNFTHAPAAKDIIGGLGLNPFFDVLLISGDLGYCKPHPLVFQKLVEQLEVEKERVLYIGDDLECDVRGAMDAGLQPLWMTYVKDKKIPFLSGYDAGEPEELEREVPRVPTWNTLLSMLFTPVASKAV